MTRRVGLCLLCLSVGCREEDKTPHEDSAADLNGTLIITEIMGPSGEIAEWFELRNLSDRAFAPGELWISDGASPLALASEAPLEPGAYAVLSTTAADASTGATHVYDQAVYNPEGGLLQVLWGETELDAVAYGGWGVGSPTDSTSLALDPMAEAAHLNDEAGRWCLTPHDDGVLPGWQQASPGEPNESCPGLDYDGDGYGLDDGDCDDLDASVNPGVSEIWYDAVDQDCDEQSDFDIDQDRDDAVAYGGTDCDDLNDDANPREREVCDEVDNDCDGSVDEDDDVQISGAYVDEDGDGYGTDERIATCEALNAGYAPRRGDCDDSDASVFPTAEETWYDGVDQDCSATSDYDLDEDGHDASAYGGGDCDDTSTAVRPGAMEVCNGYDDDCDGNADDADSELFGSRTWYVDQDGDGYGQTGSDYDACVAPMGYVSVNDDCADGDSAVHPGAAEVWYDGVDQDCDGWSDDDADGDGYDAGDMSLDPTADCDDTSSRIYPGAPHYLGIADPRCDASVVLDILSLAMAETEGMSLGEALSAAGDLDGDGLADLLIGAPDADSDGDAGAGLVRVVLGDASAAPDVSDPDATLHGLSNGDAAGEALAGLGDLDGDGYDDVGVGASGVDDGASAAGAAYVCAGPAEGDLLLSDADAIWLGVVTRDTAGRAVAVSADGDGDGVAELYVAAPNEDTVGGSAGAVYWLAAGLDGGSLSDASGIWLGERTADRAGTDLAGAGDVDGDGVEDLWVGADNGSDSAHATRPGAVWLLSGVSGGTLSLADAAGRIEGVADGDEFGAGLAAVGDLDGDGYADLWVGAPAQDSGAGLADAGGAWLIRGPVTGASGVSSVAAASVEGEEAGARVGASVAGLGDLDEDGLNDLVVGAPGATGGAAGSGALWVLPGAISGATTLSAVALDTQVGVDEDEAAATALAGVGDVNGDGQPDLLVGLPERGAVGAVALIGPP